MNVLSLNLLPGVIIRSSHHRTVMMA